MNAPRNPTFCFLVRHRPSRSVVAHAAVLDDGALQLLRLTPDVGPVPDAGGLFPLVFADRRTLRQAVLELLRREECVFR